MKTKIIIPLMAFALLLSACGRNEQPARKTTSGKNMALPAILTQSDINPGDVFSVSRSGERVTIRWKVDFSACRDIRIQRNQTGGAKNRQEVASLPASSKEFVDSVPEAGAYWYWLSVGIGENKNKSKVIGPIRAKADAGRTGKYIDASKNISLIVQRTKSSAVVAWDLPEAEYKNIVIKRNPSPDFQQTRNQRTTIHRTLEWQGDLTDTLPDPNADYWYWIDVTKKDGAVISKGPIKAVFSTK